MKVTYYGHSCFSVELNRKHLLFDPYITPNPLAKAIKIKDIRSDYIFISHGHDDHLADAAKIAKKTQASVIANFEVAEWLNKKNVPNVISVNPGGCVDCSNAGVIQSQAPNGAMRDLEFGVRFEF